MILCTHTHHTYIHTHQPYIPTIFIFFNWNSNSIKLVSLNFALKQLSCVMDSHMKQFSSLLINDPKYRGIIYLSSLLIFIGRQMALR